MCEHAREIDCKVDKGSPPGPRHPHPPTISGSAPEHAVRFLSLP